MSLPEGIVQAQMEALLRRVAREQETLSRRSRDAAEEQSRGIVARAREEARARTRLAAQEARQTVERALADRRAALETTARQREQALLRELMDSAWAALPGALAATWQDAGRRREWCESACALARRIVMGDGPFTIEIDATAPAELTESLRRCLPDGGTPPAISALENLGPGLRIRRGLACVDATVPGLLASRERVEAELLAELDALLEERRRMPT
jgi:predicted  nucleic acid-binding Zn-ribbon protein